MSSHNPKIKKVLLYGAGNFGYRWLQGLMLNSSPLVVHVYDLNKVALLTCQQRLQEIQINQAIHSVVYRVTHELTCDKYDLAIIATTSSVRCEAIELLVNVIESRYWILEKVLAQSIEEVNRIQDKLKYNNVWVNSPRRGWKWYQGLKLRHKVYSPVQIKITGGPWELIGNIIHFLDLIAWWLEDEIMTIDCSSLSPHWQLSKTRNRTQSEDIFYTSSGKIIARFKNKSILAIDWVERNELTISIANKEFELVINEVAGDAYFNNKPTIFGEMEMQSKTTPGYISQLEASGSLTLPTLADSASMHNLLINALLPNWWAFIGNHSKSVPIS